MKSVKELQADPTVNEIIEYKNVFVALDEYTSEFYCDTGTTKYFSQAKYFSSADEALNTVYNRGDGDYWQILELKLSIHL